MLIRARRKKHFVISGASPGDGGGGGDSLLFESQWDTALGTSDAALGDGGKWPTFSSIPADVMEVIDPATAGWTGDGNVLRITHHGATLAGLLVYNDLLPTPEAGQHVYIRNYIRNTKTSESHNHDTCLNGAPDGIVPDGADFAPGIQLAYFAHAGRAGGWNPFMRTYYSSTGAAMGYPTNMWILGPFDQFGTGIGSHLLNHSDWYRFEWDIEYVTERTYRVYPYIFDMAGTQLYDVNDYYENDSTTTTLQDFYDGGGTFGLQDLGGGVYATEAARQISLGNEGPSGTTDTGENWYYTNFGVSTAGLIGA